MIRCQHEDSSLWAPGAAVELSESDSNHLCAVMRAEAGVAVTLLDGRGGIAEAELSRPHRKHAEVVVRSVSRAAPPVPRRILEQAVIRAERMDWLVQKAVELGGVTEIWPLQTDWCVVRVPPADAERKADRWRAVAWAACKQSGNPWLPRIAPAMRLDAAIARLTGRDACFGALQPGAVPLPDCLTALRRADCPELAVFIGPEGDFTPAEVSSLLAAGVRPVTLGENVLRVETASLFVLSAIKYAWLPCGDVPSPPSERGVARP